MASAPLHAYSRILTQVRLSFVMLPYMTQLLDQKVSPEERVQYYALHILTCPKITAFKR